MNPFLLTLSCLFGPEFHRKVQFNYYYLCVKENKKFKIYYRDLSTIQLPSEAGGLGVLALFLESLSRRPRFCAATLQA